jgi:hypothetical protein
VIFNDDYRTEIQRHRVYSGKVTFQLKSRLFGAEKHPCKRTNFLLEFGLRKKVSCISRWFLRESLMKFKLTRVRRMYEDMAGKGVRVREQCLTCRGGGGVKNM